MRPRYFVPVILLLLTTLVLSPGVGLAQDGYEQLVSQALSDLTTKCADAQVNEVCVGFDSVQVAFTGAPPADFTNVPGDKAVLTDVASVQTTPVNLSSSTLGIAVMYVKTTNVPGALVDQSAMFMLIGDVEVTNAVAPDAAVVPGTVVSVTTAVQTALRRAPGGDAPIVGTIANGAALEADAVSPGGTWVRVMYENQNAWVSVEDLAAGADLSALPIITRDSRTPMQAFAFRTGGATPPSLAVPPDVVLVQSPKDIAIDIWANDVHIRVEGSIFLRTLADGRLQLITADGEATAFPETPNQVGVIAGTSILIGGETWTEWRILSQGEWDGFGQFEIIPGNIMVYALTLPDIVVRSSIEPQPPVVIVVPGFEIIPVPPTPPTFPLVPVTFGELGADLERIAWQPFEIGCGVCDPDLVLYHSDSDGDWDIYRLTGSGLSEAANNVSHGDASQDLMPSFSADGQWVAYATNRHVLGGWEIQVSRLDGSADARVSFNSGNDMNPVWGPSNLIVWETNRHGNWDLYMIDVTTGEETRLTDDAANDINPYWLPDGGCGQPEGGRIVFQSDRDGDWEIYELDVVSMELTKLTDNDVEDEMPILSRDGSMLGWLQLNEYGIYDLWVMDLGTMEATRQTNLGVDVAGHMFAPDDSLIAFHANADGDYEVYASYLATRAVVPVTDNEAEDRAPTFRCDDPMQVIFHTDMVADDNNPGQRELYEARIPVEGGTPGPATRLTQDVEADDIYAEADGHEERESKEGRKPAHP